MGSVKKIPMRQCIGCGEMKPKKDLIRVLKNDEGDIFIDNTGKKNGRGSYICKSEACLLKAIKNHGLERSFKTKVSGEIYESLTVQINEIINN